MHISTKAFLFGLALTLLLGLSEVRAQGIVTLAEDDDAPQQLNEEPSSGTLDLGLAKEEIPDVDALSDGKPSDDSKMITPPENNSPLLLGTDEVQQISDNSVRPTLGNEQENPVKSVQPVSPVGVLGAAKFGNVDNSVFERMSNLEKQTAVLTMELRREQIQNEIDAVKNLRAKAIEEAREAEEEKIRKKAEWEREQVIKVIKEQQKLKELEMSQEKIRQEKMLKDYKNYMLAEKQDWIKQNANLYLEMENLKQQKENFAEEVKAQYQIINQEVKKVNDDAVRAKDAFSKEISELQTQISVLKARLEAQEREIEAEKQNPFAEGATDETAVAEAISAPGGDITVINEKLGDLYVVMEIRGQGDELFAKLMNKDGTPFMVRKGSLLQNGYTVDEITSSYIRTDNNGLKDYLYFNGGGMWEKRDAEPAEPSSEKKSDKSLFIENEIPNIGKEMMVR